MTTRNLHQRVGPIDHAEQDQVEGRLLTRPKRSLASYRQKPSKTSISVCFCEGRFA